MIFNCAVFMYNKAINTNNGNNNNNTYELHNNSKNYSCFLLKNLLKKLLKNSTIIRIRFYIPKR